MDQVFVGLGNPGATHASQRHNAGFMALSSIAAEHRFGRTRQRFRGAIRSGRIDGASVLALCPLTWMNRSGESVSLACRFYKVPPARVTVFYDDLDLAAGKVRVRHGGGSGGHRGIDSIDRCRGRDYRRVRIGIGRPPHGEPAERYVLRDFGRAELDWLQPLLAAMATSAPLLVSGEDDRFMNRVVLDAPPPAAGGD